MKQKKRDQKGVTILISVLILSSVIILALAVSDIVGRANRNSRDIGLSEVAYFAAEKGVEQALYSIEKERTISGLDGIQGNLTDITEANWSREIEVLSDSEATDMDCDTLALVSVENGVCVDETNPNQPKVKIKLRPNDSFQLDLDFGGMSGYLPNGIKIDGISSSNASTTVLNISAGESETPENLNNISVSGRQIILKITNKSDVTENIEISSSGGANNPVPLSFLIISTGSYKEQKRVIQVERRNWQIY
jgi:hypothetical protein